MKKCKRIVSLILAFVMTASLFSNWPMPTFAADGVENKDLMPVVDTTLADDEVVLYKGTEAGAESVTVSGLAGVNVQLHKQVTLTDSGKVFYHYYYVDGAESEEAIATMAEYYIVGAEDVVYIAEPTPTPTPTQEPTGAPSTAPILGAVAPIADEEDTDSTELIYRQMTDGATGVQVNATVPVNATLVVKSATIADLGVDTALYEITEDSLFYDIKIMNGDEEYQPEDGVEVVFPATAASFPLGSLYNAYHIHNGTVQKKGAYIYDGNTVTVKFDGLSYIGISADPMTDTLYTKVGDDYIYVEVSGAVFTSENTLTVTPVTSVAGTEHYLIWGDSQFYNISISNYELPEDKEAIVYFPVIDGADDNSHTAAGIIGTTVEPYNVMVSESTEYNGRLMVSAPALGIIGVVKSLEYSDPVDFAAQVKPATTETIRLYAYWYPDLTLYEEVELTGEEILEVYEKFTAYNGSQSAEFYTVLSCTGNDDLSAALEEQYSVVLVSDVEIYVEEELTNQTLTDKNGTGITVTGDLPAGVTLEVVPLTDDQINEVIDTDYYPLGTTAKGFAIKLMRDGKEYDPNGYVNLKITKDNLEINGGTGVVVYSNHDNQTDIIGPVIYGGNNFNLSVEDVDKFIFTDLFKEGGFEEIEGKFNKETVTLYRDLFPYSPVFTVENATSVAVTSSMYFVDQNGIKWRMLNEDFIDADGEYYVWAKDEDITQCELLPEQQLVDDATGIKVEGRLPEGVVLTVTPLERGDVELDEEKYPLNADMFLYDITLTLDGEKYQPEDSVAIIFPQEMCVFENGLFYVVYHVHDDGTVDVMGPYGYVTGDIRITVDNFSSFGFSEDYALETIETFPAVAKNTVLKLYKDHLNIDDYIEVNVTDKDIVYPYTKITLTDGTVKYALDYYTVEESDENYNSELAAVLNGNPAYNIVFADDIEEYIPTVDQTVKDTATGITVSGELPAGTTVVVKEKSIPADWDAATYPMGKNTKVFDISLSFRGEEYQPEGYVDINIPKDILAMGADKAMAVYHVHDGNTDVIGPVVYAGKDFSLSVDNFSDFVFTDAFGEGHTTGWRGFLNKDQVEVFENVFPGSASYVMTNAYDYEVKGDIYYKAEDGSMWFMLEDGIADANGEKYIFVKSEDVRLTYLDDVCIVMPTVGFTQVAQPLPPLVSVSEVQMESTFGGRSLLANSRASQQDEGLLDDGLFTSKNVTGNEEDGYTITLEAYVTGNVTVTRKSVPTDIVLVLDQSGSMANNMGSYDYSSIYNRYAYSYYNTSSPIYFKVGDVYYPVAITRTGDTKYVELTGDNEDIRDANGTKYALDEYGEYCELIVTRSGNNSWNRVYTYSYTDSKGDTHAPTSNGEIGTPPIKIYQVDDDTTYTYTYSYIDNDGVQHSQQFVGTSARLPNGYYTATFDEDEGENRLESLREAVQTFVESVADDADGTDNILGTADDVNHRIAVVGFGRGNYTSNNTGRYQNTEVFVGATEYTYNAGNTSNSTQNNDAAQDHYGDVMQEMTDVSGLANIRATVGYDNNGDGDYNDRYTNANNNTVNESGVLAAAGGTYVDLGLEMANGILEAEKDYKASADETQRNKVVIVFTDGAPGYNGNWNGANYTYSGDADKVADRAVNNARVTKNTYGATVYTIGIFAGADAGRFVINSDNTITLGYREYKYNDNSYAYDNSNRYMHYLSSNYTPSGTSASMTEPGTESFPRTSGVPNGDSFYLSAANAEELNSIFQKLSETVNGGSDKSFEELTIVKDIISPYFKLPTGATTSSIKAYTADYIEDPDNKGTGIFDTREEFTDATVTIGGAENKTISVNNFDFAENWVGTTTNADNSVDYHGKKLIIEIPIVVETDFLGGNNVPTNGASSGIYENADEEEPVREFNVPKVDVSLKTLNPVLENQYIYITNNADLDTMIAGSSDSDSYRYEYKLNGNIYNFDGDNNGFVNITYNVYETDPADSSATPIRTLTINAEQSVGSWDDADTIIEGLTADKTYYITCTTAPSTPGTYTAVTSNPADTGTVYVYKPEVTFKDLGLYYDGTTVLGTEDLDKAYSSHTWVGTQPYDADRMHNYGTSESINRKVPELDYSYNPKSVGVTTEDKYVNVTVETIGTDNPRTLADTEVTFEHTNCAGETFVDSNGEFTVHVFTPAVQFKDSNVYLADKLPELSANASAVTWTHPTVTQVDLTIVNPDSATLPTISYTVIDEDKHVTTYGTDKLITTADKDIYVKATVTSVTGADITSVTDITHENPCVAVGDDCGYTLPADGSSHFVLHVFKPIIPFQDTTVYYGDIADIKDNVLISEITWKHDDTLNTDVTMTGTKPSYFNFEIVWDTTLLVSQGGEYVVNTTNAIPFNVTEVYVGSVTDNIISKVEITHKNCTEGEVLPDYAAGDKAEFVIHVKTASLDVEKETDPTGLDEAFDIAIKFTGIVAPTAFNYTIGDKNYTAIVTNNETTIQIKDGETAKFTGLPTGEYEVTELTTATNYSPKYITTVSVDGGTPVTSNETAVTFDTSLAQPKVHALVKFINKLNLTSLTIYKEAEGSTYNVKDSFIFNVYKEDGTLFATVALKSGEYITIPNLVVGEIYTVVEDTDWSWRYTNTVQEAPAGNKLVYDTNPGTEDSLNLYSFTNKVIEPLYWLDNESHVENLWGSSGPDYN